MGGATRSSTSILHERRIRQLNVVRRHSGRSKGSHALSNLRCQVRYDEQPTGSEDPELRKGQACVTHKAGYACDARVVLGDRLRPLVHEGALGIADASLLFVRGYH